MIGKYNMVVINKSMHAHLIKVNLWQDLYGLLVVLLGFVPKKKLVLLGQGPSHCIPRPDMIQLTQPKQLPSHSPTSRFILGLKVILTSESI